MKFINTKFILFIILNISHVQNVGMGLEIEADNNILRFAHKEFIHLIRKVVIGQKNYFYMDEEKYGSKDIQIPIGYTIVKDFKVTKCFINNDNELELEIKNIIIYNQVWVQVFYNVYTDESYLEIDGKINLVQLKLIFEDLKREKPIPQIKIKDTFIDFSYLKDFVVKSNNFIFNFGAKLGKKLIKKQIDIQMKKILLENLYQSINQMIELYLDQKYTINKNIEFSMKAIKKPVFGGNKHKRIKLFFETLLTNPKKQNQQYSSENSIKIYFKKPFFQSVANNKIGLTELFDDFMKSFKKI